MQDNYELIAPIYRQIEPFRTRRAGQLSGGMKQKLALCCALVHRPRVLFLDEPTTGWMPVSRSEFWDMLARLREMGISMLVSTPYMDEAGRCDRVALINAGRILEINTPQGVVEGFDEPLYALSGEDVFGLLQAARSYLGVRKAYPFGGAHHLVVGRDFDPQAFAAYLHARGLRGSLSLCRADPGIEDVFIKRMENA